jgi:hypothetical protein
MFLIGFERRLLIWRASILAAVSLRCPAGRSISGRALDRP